MTDWEKLKQEYKIQKKMRKVNPKFVSCMLCGSGRTSLTEVLENGVKKLVTVGKVTLQKVYDRKHLDNKGNPTFMGYVCNRCIEKGKVVRV